VRSVSAVTRRMALGCSPSSSATMVASTESDPCPMSMAPLKTVTPPRSMVTWHSLWGMRFQ